MSIHVLPVKRRIGPVYLSPVQRGPHLPARVHIPFNFMK